MTVDVYDDLGERLDRLADAFVGDVVLAHPADVDLMSDEPRRLRDRLVVAGVAAVLLLIVVLALQGGPDVSTEVPAEEPDSSTTVPLLDLLPDWASLSPTTEITGSFADFDFSQAFDVSTIRQIEFEAGTVFVGLDPDGTMVTVGLTPPGIEGGMTSSRLRLPDLIGRSATVVLGFGTAGFEIVGGVAPRGVVAVSYDGEPVEFKLGAFLLNIADRSRRAGYLSEPIEFEYADGTTEPPLIMGTDGAPGASGTLSATIGDTTIDTPLTAVACAQTRSNPISLDIAGSTGSIRDSDFYGVNLTNGELIIDTLADGQFLGDRIKPADLDIQFGTDLLQADIEWHTQQSSGHITVQCGELIVDATELNELLRAT